jgi:hypothetical protein
MSTNIIRKCPTQSLSQLSPNDVEFELIMLVLVQGEFTHTLN